MRYLLFYLFYFGFGKGRTYGKHTTQTWLIIQGGLRIGISCSKVERANDCLARNGSVVAEESLSVSK